MLESSVESGVTVLRLSGTVDAPVLKRLRRQLLSAIVSRQRVVLDLTEAAELPGGTSSALASILRGAAAWPESRLSLCCTDPATIELLTGQSVLRHVPIAPSVAAATSILDGGLVLTERMPLAAAQEPARQARRFVADVLERWGEARIADDAALVTAELTTNAVQHSAGPVEAVLEMSESYATVSLVDGGGGDVRLLLVALDSDRGRGMRIVAQVATAWGVEAGGDTRKTVWATFSR